MNVIFQQLGETYAETAWANAATSFSRLCAVTVTGKAFCTVYPVPAELASITWKKVVPMSIVTCGLSVIGEAHCWNNEGKSTILGSDIGMVWDDLTSNLYRIVCLQSGEAARCWDIDSRSENFPNIFTERRQHGEERRWRILAPPCGITTAHELVCESEQEPARPEPVANPQRQWSAISCYSDRRCALSMDGKLYCWGYEVELMGVTPTAPLALLDSWSDRFAGITLHPQRSITWGAETGRAPFDVTAEAQEGPIKTLALGNVHTCIISSQDRLICSGLCMYGECDVPGGGALRWKAVSAESHVTCGITVDSNLCCWGRLVPSSLACDDEGHNAHNIKGVWNNVAAGWTVLCGVEGGNVHCWAHGRAWEGMQEEGGWLTVEASNSDRIVCGITASHALRCIGNVGLLRYPAGLSGHPGWASVALNGDIQCGVLQNGTGLCSGWVAGDAEYVVFMPQVQWRVLKTTSFSICGIAVNDTVICWSNLKPLPTATGPPRLDVDMRTLLGCTLARMSCARTPSSNAATFAWTCSKVHWLWVTRKLCCHWEIGVLPCSPPAVSQCRQKVPSIFHQSAKRSWAHHDL